MPRKKKKKTIRWPKKPSKLLEMAMSDFLKIEKDKKYVIDMDFWHQPYTKDQSTMGTTCVTGAKVRRKDFNHCSVCLAGSVMASRFDLSELERWHPEDLGGIGPNYANLRALDLFRIGCIGDALSRLNIPLPAGLPSLLKVVATYDEDRLQWVGDMYKIIAMLKQFGL